ncbi:1-phosphofructokinase family hexose kinase [Propioniciclava coleopterorum]|uniref:1-phosphofructokinase family hexose kinase n=1 Tax=Propioniciclava coleopterorum TaxID=2714937 RepID=A0A6G7Y4J5_9ACTN|nr:1-phosphofructokinase family hexose kinase [Propioniciclava coleopterorum]QIK71586.1 1-phosphofructokinase family hexose kinase [Propioniciclava coleopterorum]
MIITFTPNPSLDRTASLPHDLRLGKRNQLGGVSTQAAGRGVNVSRAVHNAGKATLAVLPLDPDDPLTEALRERGVPNRPVPVGRRARTNLAVTHPDGTVTKFVEPGEPVTPENVSALFSALMAAVPGSDWLALCGSLPPGAPADWFVRLTQLAHEVNVPVAIDTHGQALAAVMAALPDTVPDVFSPNAAELQHATGVPLTDALQRGDIEPAIAAARSLVAQGIPRVLATIGARGALLVTHDGAWHARVAPVDVVSAVGAGDSALAGYLLARLEGADEPASLARAVAYGTACVLMPGANVPLPEQADAVEVTVTALGA